MARNHIIPVFVSHLGCPQQCVFCNQCRIAGRSIDVSAEDVRTAILSALPMCGPGAELAFYGGSFTAIPMRDQEELLSAVQLFIQNGSVRSVRLSTRPDCISEEILLLLKKNHVSVVELGCQSADDHVLTACRRGHTVKDIENAVSLLRKHEFKMILQMMTGLPGSSEESDLATGHFLADLQPDGVRIYPTVVVKGTPLLEMYEKGLYRPQTVSEAAALCAKLYRVFSARDIPVLRYGLQPTDSMTAGDAVAGPYHPAFGEYVKSRILYDQACALLSAADTREVTILVSPRDLSALIGQKRSNIEALMQKFPKLALRVRTDGSLKDMVLQLM